MQDRGWFRILLVVVALGPAACAHRPVQQPFAQDASAGTPEHVFTVVSDTLLIDTTYHSMEGPYQQVRFTIGSTEQVDTLWITGIAAEVVAPDLSPVPAEFFCHANLDYDAEEHRRLFNSQGVTSNRLFTLSQGHEAMRFPDGFGIPVRSDEPLFLTTQVLSNNGVEAEKQVRVRVRIQYVRKGERKMKSLAMTSAAGVVSTNGHQGHFGMHADDHAGHSMSGTSKSGIEYRDSLGQKFSGHWVVPPGKHSVRTVVTKWMSLGSDRDVHYIGVHVHPYAQRITLRDRTTGKDVFTSLVRPLEGRIGISKVTDFSSARGMRLFASHDYELIADYENPTAEPVDAMAVLFLYVRDTALAALDGR